MKLFLKGSRCDTPKCGVERRDSAPGMHQYRRGKLTDYGVHLREKQKVKHYYGVLERQFRRYFAEAQRSKGNTGATLMSLLERRLDNVVHRLGFAACRGTARQMVAHGHVLVNGRKCDIPSMLVKPGDVIKVKANDRSLKMAREGLQKNLVRVPEFLVVTNNSDAPEGSMTRLPNRADVDERINEIREQLIIEIATR